MTKNGKMKQQPKTAATEVALTPLQAATTMHQHGLLGDRELAAVSVAALDQLTRLTEDDEGAAN